MNGITIIYILLMVAGIAWVVWKVKLYIEKERERESRLDSGMLYDETFKNYLKDLKERNTKKNLALAATEASRKKEEKSKAES